MEKQRSVYHAVTDRVYGFNPNFIFARKVRGSKLFARCLQRDTVLLGHEGCVNTISWNDVGTLLVSGSDDCFLNIYKPFQNKLVHNIRSGHRANIFSAKFLPCTSDKKIISCAGDGMIQFTEVERESLYGHFPFNCHSGTAYEIITTPGDPHTFLSCGEDGTVRQFDLRTKDKCICQECKEDILIDCDKAVTSISINPMIPYHLAIGCEDSTVRIFDRRILSTDHSSSLSNQLHGIFSQFRPKRLKSRTCRVTSLQHSDDGTELLVSYCSDYVYLFDVNGKTEEEEREEAKQREKDRKFAENGVHSEDSGASGNVPPLKRLRLRGDWSDTGPNARPESEQPSAESSLMQRMSDMFTRWLEESFRDAQRRRTDQSTESPSSSSSSPTPSPFVAVPGVEGVDTETADDVRDEAADRPSSAEGLEARSTTEDLESRPPTAIGLQDTYTEQTRVSSSQFGSDENIDLDLRVETDILPDRGRLDSLPDRGDSSSCMEGGSDNIGTAVPRTDLVESHQKHFTDEKLPTLGEHDLKTSGNANSSMEKVEYFEDASSTIAHNGDASKHKDSVQEDQEIDTLEFTNSDKPNVDGCLHHDVVQSESIFDKNEQSLDLKLRDQGDSSSVSSASYTTASEAASPTMECMPDIIPVQDLEGGVLSQGAQTFLAGENNIADKVAFMDITTQSSNASIAETVCATHAESTDQTSEQSVDRHESEATEERSETDQSASAETNGQSEQFSASFHARNLAASRIQAHFLRMKKNRSGIADLEKRVRRPGQKMFYHGHRNARTMIKEANFWGDSYVCSGSDCGRVFVWDKFSGEIVNLLQGDRHVVNCVQPHPTYPVLATSGIDYDVKLWVPTASEPTKLEEVQEAWDEVVSRNERMLEESRDTITVPASFMLRMLASLNHARIARRFQGQGDEDTDSSDDD